MTKVLGDRVLVKPIYDEVSKSIVVVQEDKNKIPTKGIVDVVGDGFQDIDMVVKEGDMVLFGRSSGYPIEENGEKYLMLKMGDIIAIIEDGVNVTFK